MKMVFDSGDSRPWSKSDVGILLLSVYTVRDSSLQTHTVTYLFGDFHSSDDWVPVQRKNNRVSVIVFKDNGLKENHSHSWECPIFERLTTVYSIVSRRLCSENSPLVGTPRQVVGLTTVGGVATSGVSVRKPCGTLFGVLSVW